MFMQPSRPDQTNNLQPRVCCGIASPRSLKWPWPYLVFDPVFVDGRSVVLWIARQRFPAFIFRLCLKSIRLAQPAICDNSMTKRVDDRRCFFLSYSLLGLRYQLANISFVQHRK
jgi:hypothetical protein